MSVLFYESSNSDLYHHGTLGQKWGIRRYQNKDGSLTPRGKRHVAQLQAEYETLTRQKEMPPPKKRISEMSNEEIQKEIDRKTLENKYKDMLAKENAKKVSKGKKFITDMLKQPTQELGGQLYKYAVGKAVNSLVGDEVIKVGKDQGKKKKGNSSGNQNKPNNQNTNSTKIEKPKKSITTPSELKKGEKLSDVSDETLRAMIDRIEKENTYNKYIAARKEERK